MSGQRLILWFAGFVAVFAAALIYFQFFAYYQRDSESRELVFGDVMIPVAYLDRVDASTSPLKLRACFQTDPAIFEGMKPAANPVPLTPPPWFGCFDAERISLDIDAGLAQAYAVALEYPAGFDVIAAVYPDGKGFVWRQLGQEFAE